MRGRVPSLSAIAWSTPFVVGASVVVALLAASCSSSGGNAPVATLTTAELMDPASCESCHPQAYTEWTGSMHAYAADDPVFVAMNARGQRETNGALGDFCVKCHAPMAVATSAIAAPYDTTKLPAPLKGVTCFFCHSVTSVNGAHDNPLVLASDGVLRAGIKNPLPNTGHKAMYEALLDRNETASATLCGSCHDVTNQLGTAIERTYAEWQTTVFAHASPPVGLTCGNCHMNGTTGAAASYPGASTSRTVHSHEFPGVDVALDPTFPLVSAQTALVQSSLDNTLQAALCVKGVAGQATIQVVLDNVGAGHLWPSGATQDRRAWVEVVASSGGGDAGPLTPFFTSGVVADGQSVLAIDDPSLWLIRDCMSDAQGKPVDMFWQAASHDSNQLPGALTNVTTDPRYYLTHVMRVYPAATSSPAMLAVVPDEVTMRVRLTPIGQDVLDDLVQSGDLDAGVKAEVPTFSLGGTTLTWTSATATLHYAEDGLPVSCVTSGLTNGGSGANPAPTHTTCSP